MAPVCMPLIWLGGLPSSRRETVDGTFKKISRWLGYRPGGLALPYAGDIRRYPLLFVLLLSFLMLPVTVVGRGIAVRRFLSPGDDHAPAVLVAFIVIRYRGITSTK